MNVKPEDRPKIIAVIVLFVLALVIGVWRLKSVLAPPSSIAQKPSPPTNPPPPGGATGTLTPSPPPSPPPASEAEENKGPVVLIVRDPFTTTPSSKKTQAPAPPPPKARPSAQGHSQRPKKGGKRETQPPKGPLPLPVPSGNLTVRPLPTQPQTTGANLPVFVLTGIVEGDIPVAILKKLGTEEASVMVREGEWIGDRRILIRSIQADRIVLQIGKTFRTVRVGEQTTSPSQPPQAVLHPDVSQTGSKMTNPANPT